MEKRSFGDFGEEMAAQYLRRQGYAILARNYRCRFGDVATQILIPFNDKDHPLKSLIPRALADNCPRYAFKKVSYPIMKTQPNK